MDFTREPVIETIITPREGCKLALRSSKGMNQEEYFVDSVEVISFGKSLFFRSLERPRNFLLPVSDYEILEVRETKVMIKHSTPESGSIKIGSKDKESKYRKEKKQTNKEPFQQKTKEITTEVKVDKKRERRKSRRKRVIGEEENNLENVKEETPLPKDEKKTVTKTKKEPLKEALSIPNLLPPPRQLISETIAKYKDISLLKEKAEKELEISLEKAGGMLQEPQEVPLSSEKSFSLEVPEPNIAAVTSEVKEEESSPKSKKTASTRLKKK